MKHAQFEPEFPHYGEIGCSLLECLHCKKFLSIFKTLFINLPLVESFLEMAGYEKFMKELVTKKISMAFVTIEVSHSCNDIMSRNVASRKKTWGHLLFLQLSGCFNLLKHCVIWGLV